ncbi:MAG: anion permease [Acidimicrobiales bacterium]
MAHVRAEAVVDDDEALPSPVRAFIPRLVLVGAVAAILTLGDPNPALAMVLIGFTGVVLIVTDSRFAFERALEDRHIPSREAWVPILVLLALLGGGYVTGSEFSAVVRGKGDVIVFILSFALVAEGLGRCGFFKFLAFRLTERCHGNTMRLILYLFLLTSILTYFTSNDIVILTMTPIVMSVAYQSRMRNAKLLLLSQFVAANTVSMGLLIGSPTNLILGRATGLDFIEYFILMVVPTFMALLVTFIVITKVHEVIGQHRWGSSSGLMARAFGTWDHAPSYATPQFSEYRTLTLEMRRWLGVFAAAVVLLATVTAIQVSLLWAAIPIAVGSLAFLSHEEVTSGQTSRRARAVARPLAVLPFGIIFFGLAYFTLADGLAHTDWVRDTAVPKVESISQQQTPVASWAAIGASGATVNVINDLPASALAGEVYEQTSFDHPSDKAITLQGTLVGLNTGTYVTPIGALAGLIWFDILRRERRRYARGDAGVSRTIATPTRRDMILYGSMTFVASGLVIGAANFGFVSVLDILLGPIEGPGHFDSTGGRPLMVVLSCSLLVLVPLAFRRLLIRHNVVLSHMADLFVVLTRLRVAASRHRIAFSSAVAGLIFVAAGTLLYWAEDFHATQYGTEPPFHSIGSFMTWLLVFVGSGFDNDHFPKSVLGAALAALLALGSIAAVIFLVKISSADTDETLRTKIAKGEIPTDRIVIFHASDERLGLAHTILRRPGRFVVAIGDPGRSRDLRLSLDADHRDRAAFVDHAHSMSALVREYSLAEASELILMSSSKGEDFENLSLLLEIDRVGYLPGEGDALDAPARLPRVLIESAMADMRDLLDQSVSEVFRQRIRVIHLSERFGEYLLAENHHDPALLNDYYGAPADAADAAATGFELVRDGSHQMVDVWFDVPLDPLADIGHADDAVERRHPWILRQATAVHLRERLVEEGEGQAPILGVIVRAGDRYERLSLVAYSAVSARGRIHGVTVLAAAEPDQVRAAAAVELQDVIVVGSTSLAEQTLATLLEGGATRITHLVHAHARTSAELASHPELTVVPLENEPSVAAQIIERAASETRILLFDDVDDRLLSTERLLEAMSAWRLRLTRGGETPPVLIVQCLGEARREHLQRFMVDEIIDSSWIDRSYFEVLAGVYLDLVVSGHAEPGDAFLTAGGIANQLATYEIHEARGLELQGPLAAPIPVVGLPLAEVAELGNQAMELQGPVIGLARIDVDHASVTLRIVSPLADAIVGPDDLILVAPHLSERRKLARPVRARARWAPLAPRAPGRSAAPTGPATR